MKIDKRSKEWKQAKKVAYEEGYNKEDKGYDNIVMEAYNVITDPLNVKWENPPEYTQTSNDTIIPQTEESVLESFPDGLGDKLEVILEKTGVKKIVEIFTKGKDCGCDGRKESLNSWGVEMGITRKVECLLEWEYKFIKEYNKRHNPKHFTREDVFELSNRIYPRVFNKRISICKNCNAGVKQMNNVVKDLNKLVDFYELEELKP